MSRPPTLSPLMLKGTPKPSRVGSQACFLCFLPSAWAHSQEENSCSRTLHSMWLELTQWGPRLTVPPAFQPLLTPRAPDPTLFFFPNGQRLARLRLEAARSSGLPSGVPRLLSEGTRFITWLKSSNSKSPGRANPDLCNSMRTCESFGKGQGVNGHQRLAEETRWGAPPAHPSPPGLTRSTHVLGVHRLCSHLHALQAFANDGNHLQFSLR